RMNERERDYAMLKNHLLLAAAVNALVVATGAGLVARADDDHPIKHVLLISIDGMHALDFANCANGVNDGAPYCPNMAALAQHGVTFTQASTSRPSDSFPGLTAIVTGGSPRSTGAFYDVSYDRSLSPPRQTTPGGIVGGVGLCPSVVGTQVGFDETADIDLTRLDAGGGSHPDFLSPGPHPGGASALPPAC